MSGPGRWGETGGRASSAGAGGAWWQVGPWGACALVVGLLLPAGPVQGQAAPDSVGVEAVRALRPGASVRLTTAGMRRRGVVQEAGAGGLLLRPDGGGDPMRFEPAVLDSLWVRSDAAGAGAAVGTLLGAIPVVATCGRDTDECGLFPNALVVVGVSAGVGYLVGRGIETWRQVIP